MGTNEPETLCVSWLSSCQQFHLMQDLYIIAVNSAFTSLDKKERKSFHELAKEVIKTQILKEKKYAKYAKYAKYTKYIFNILKIQKKKAKIDVIVQKLLDSVKRISPSPIVGAVAVRYKHNNSFSVFIGIAMGEDEEKDIAYIKSMGQRQQAHIARAIFPQFDDMAYHS